MPPRKNPAQQVDSRDVSDDEHNGDPSAHDVVPSQGAGPPGAFQTANGQPLALRQRDPPTFLGLELEDVEDWLEGFERISRYNRWDARTQLNNVILSLSGVARTWFVNHEAEFRDWTIFCTRSRDLLGRPTSRVAEAQQKLSYRAQQPGESYIAFIENVLSMCKRGDPSMSQTDKVKHITKGIREDAFQILMVRSASSVEENVKICKDLPDS